LRLRPNDFDPGTDRQCSPGGVDHGTANVNLSFAAIYRCDLPIKVDGAGTGHVAVRGNNSNAREVSGPTGTHFPGDRDKCE